MGHVRPVHPYPVYPRHANCSLLLPLVYFHFLLSIQHLLCHETHRAHPSMTWLAASSAAPRARHRAVIADRPPLRVRVTVPSLSSCRSNYWRELFACGYQNRKGRLFLLFVDAPIITAKQAGMQAGRHIMCRRYAGKAGYHSNAIRSKNLLPMYLHRLINCGATPSICVGSPHVTRCAVFVVYDASINYPPSHPLPLYDLSKGIQIAIQSRDTAKSPTTHSHGAKGVDCLMIRFKSILSRKKTDTVLPWKRPYSTNHF